MNVIVVDDEQFALLALKSAVEEALPGSTLFCFDDSEEALKYARSHSRIDAAFLDIEMPGLNGLQLAKQLKEIYGKTIIVFVSGYPQYAVDAFALHAKGYITKPFTSKAVREVIEHLQTEGLQANITQTEPPAKSEKRRIKEHIAAAQLPSATTPANQKLRVQTFGNFEVFANGKLLKFSRVKTKELFAYLVSRKGAMCNNNEIAAVLWEDKEDSVSLQTQFRKLVSDLTQTFDEAGMGDVLIKERGHLAIDPEKISCDFYDFCNGINVNKYMGEFMNQYGWAEFTNTYLERIHKKTIN